MDRAVLNSLQKRGETTNNLALAKTARFEIERFRIFNPAFLVDDPNGDIVREWTDKETGLIKTTKTARRPFTSDKRSYRPQCNACRKR